MLSWHHGPPRPPSCALTNVFLTRTHNEPQQQPTCSPEAPFPPALRSAAHTRRCAPRATQRVQPGGLLGGGPTRTTGWVVGGRGEGRWGANPIKILLSLRACSGEAILDRRGPFLSIIKRSDPFRLKSLNSSKLQPYLAFRQGPKWV